MARSRAARGLVTGAEKGDSQRVMRRVRTEVMSVLWTMLALPLTTCETETTVPINDSVVATTFRLLSLQCVL